IDPVVYSGKWFQADFPIWRFVLNLFFSAEIWGWSIRAFSNGPFWSLCYEFWYYIIFAAWFYLKRPFNRVVAAAICLLVGPKILVLFPIWLAGVWVYYRVKTKPVSESTGWILFVTSSAGYIVF